MNKTLMDTGKTSTKRSTKTFDFQQLTLSSTTTVCTKYIQQGKKTRCNTLLQSLFHVEARLVDILKESKWARIRQS